MQENKIMTVNGHFKQITISEIFSNRYSTMRFITFSFSADLVKKVQRKYDVKGIIGSNFDLSLKDDTEDFVYAPYKTHMKLILLYNDDQSQVRVISGSANLSYRGLSIFSDQDERVRIIDNDKKLFNFYYQYFVDRWHMYREKFLKTDASITDVNTTKTLKVLKKVCCKNTSSSDLLTYVYITGAIFDPKSFDFQPKTKNLIDYVNYVAWCNKTGEKAISEDQYTEKLVDIFEAMDIEDVRKYLKES